MKFTPDTTQTTLSCRVWRPVWIGHDHWRQREFKVGGDEPCEPTVRLPDWSELVASYSRMKSAWGWANGGQPILVCYIRKYVIILGVDIPVDVPPTKRLGDVSPASPAGLTPVAMTVDFRRRDKLQKKLYRPLWTPSAWQREIYHNSVADELMYTILYKSKSWLIRSIHPGRNGFSYMSRWQCRHKGTVT